MPPPSGQDSCGVVDDVALAVDGGLLEADDVDEEADQRAGVVRAQRGPYLGGRCLVGHDAQSRPAGGAGGLKISDLRGEPRARGEPGELDEVADEVRLVGVAAGRGHDGAVRPAAMQAGAPGRSGSPAPRPSGVRPISVRNRAAQVALAPADLAGDVGDPRRAAARRAAGARPGTPRRAAAGPGRQAAPRPASSSRNRSAQVPARRAAAPAGRRRAGRAASVACRSRPASSPAGHAEQARARRAG